jgi:hypothetical protein
MDAQQIGQRRIGAIEIHARGVGRQQSPLLNEICSVTPGLSH